MVDIKLLEQNEVYPGTKIPFQEYYKTSLKNRGADPSLIDHALDMNQRRKKLTQEFEVMRAEQNKVSAEIGKIKKAGGDTATLMTNMQGLAQKIKEAQAKADSLEKELIHHLMIIPNCTSPATPVGKSTAENKVVKTVGEAKKFSFKALDHADLGEKLGIIDFERAGKITGARFAILRGGAARLERALIQFMLDLHTEVHGYEETIPPYVVNSASLTGTGQFPKFKEDVFGLTGFDFYLVPTAEVPVTNYFAGEILNEEELPKSFAAFSPCFRSEAGSYGKDTKGLIRQHQFHKVELMKFVHPDQSYSEHEKLTEHAEKVLELLELPYRRMSLCTGDIGFGAAKCFDLEVWLPGQNAFREISSCSNFEDFQARRANIRFKPKDKSKPRFVHTLNGSGLAVGRTLIAVLENYQNEDGSVTIPKILHKYVGDLRKINIPKN